MHNKKKVFFILSSLNAGGAEKVFWLLSQHFDKALYEVNIVVLNGKKSFFSTSIDGVKVLDLNTRKASLSFLALLKLLKKERPYAIYATGEQIIALVGFTSYFINVPQLVARPANVADVHSANLKSKVLKACLSKLYLRFNTIVCQSEEISASLKKKFGLALSNGVIIPNPVLPAKVGMSHDHNADKKRIIIVGRLAKQKGHERLLEMFKNLPENYTLSVAGEGPLEDQLRNKIQELGLENRVKMLGLVDGVVRLVAEHDLFVLPSYFEGFPNSVVESLTVGTPVVAFRVGGITEIIRSGFNGYIVEPNDVETFRGCILEATKRKWDHESIVKDINDRFSISAIVNRYEKLIS